MTQILKRLGGAGLAAALGVLFFGLSGALSPADVAAESPPAPPATFVGSVLVDGEPAVAGTVIEAKINGNACGVATVFLSGSEARYSLESPALEPNNFPDCGVEGATVAFFVGGVQAQQTGTWINYDLNFVDLTVVTDDDDDDDDDDGPTPPPTGTGLAAGTESGSASWIIAAAGLVAVSLGASGIVVTRRRS